MLIILDDDGKYYYFHNIVILLTKVSSSTLLLWNVRPKRCLKAGWPWSKARWVTVLGLTLSLISNFFKAFIERFQYIYIYKN